MRIIKSSLTPLILRKLADELLGYTNAVLKKLIKDGQLVVIEVEDDE